MYDIPNDAEAVLDILQLRAAQGKPIHSAKTLRKQRDRRAEELKRTHSNTNSREPSIYSNYDGSTEGEGWRKWKKQLVDTGKDSYLRARKIAAGERELDDASITTADAERANEHSFFAFYKGVPGKLSIDQSTLRFTVMRGLHSLSKSLTDFFGKTAKSTVEVVADADSSKSRMILIVELSKVAAVKKDADANGLIVSLSDGEVSLFRGFFILQWTYAFLVGLQVRTGRET